VLAISNDRPASVADIVVEELRKKEINGPIRLPKSSGRDRARLYGSRHCYITSPPIS
jgi:hypothetical protein